MLDAIASRVGLGTFFAAIDAMTECPAFVEAAAPAAEPGPLPRTHSKAEPTQDADLLQISPFDADFVTAVTQLQAAVRFVGDAEAALCISNAASGCELG